LNKLLQESKEINARAFISSSRSCFERVLINMDNTTKHIIRNNKQLNELYDLFLDYIIDSSQLLDRMDAREREDSQINDDRI